MDQKLTYNQLKELPKNELLHMAETKLKTLIIKANQPTSTVGDGQVENLTPGVSNLQIVNVFRAILIKLFDDMLVLFKDASFTAKITPDILARFVKEDRISSADPDLLRYASATADLAEYMDLQYNPALRLLIFKALDKLLDYTNSIETTGVDGQDFEAVLNAFRQEVTLSGDGLGTILNVLLMEANIAEEDRIAILDTLNTYFAQMKEVTDIDLLDISVDLTSNIINSFTTLVGLMMYLYGEVDQDELKQIYTNLDKNSSLRPVLEKYLEG